MVERTRPLIPVVDPLPTTPAESLQRPDQRGDLLDYYLGPTGIPDRIRAVNELFNPIAGIEDAMGYSRFAANPDNPPSERLRAAGNAAFETGIAALPVGLAKIAGRYARAVPGGGQADDAQAAVETLTGANPDLQDPAVIRRDDVFRGSGPARVSYTPTPDEPFAFRKTGLDQVQDMIESGLVRPKPGGFRGQKSSLYFGTSAQPDPMAGRFTAPNETQPVVLVGDAERLASFEDGIPIDALSRVLIRQPDGSTVDALPDILRQNRAFTPDS
jgi:hypothetical protein